VTYFKNLAPYSTD